MIPVALVIGRSTGNDQTALFAVFGSIAMLVFADFGGPPAARLVAYLALAATGFLLIPLGTLCSHDAVLAAAVMALLGFTILFAGVINGYLAAGGTAALLTYILPAMVPGTASDISHRLLGFGAACCLAIPAAMLLFPKRPRDRLRSGVAKACAAVGRFVEDPTAEREAAALSALRAVHRQFASTPFRPSGPTGATGALAVMIDELDWLQSFRSFCAAASPGAARSHSERALRGLSVAMLARCSEILSGRATAPPDSDALERGRVAVIEDVREMLADPAIRDNDDRLWAAIYGAWEARVISFAVLDIADRAVLAANQRIGARTGPAWLDFIRRQSLALGASGRMILAHADVRSVWFRNSLRGAAGLALAVLLGQLVSLQHAFWVVLGSLSVLRSSALSTGATILNAIIGTTVGIVAGGILLVGLLFWPRGATAILRHSISVAVTAAARYVAVAMDGVVVGGYDSEMSACEADSAAAEERLDTAFRQRLAERPSDDLRVVELSRLMTASARIYRTAALEHRFATTIAGAPRPSLAKRLRTDAHDLADWYAAFGDAFAARAPVPRPSPSDPLEHSAMLAAVRQSATGGPADCESATGPHDAIVAALGCAFAGLHIDELHRLETRVVDAARTLHELAPEGTSAPQHSGHVSPTRPRSDPDNRAPSAGGPASRRRGG